MRDDKLPIVFKSDVWLALFGALACALIVWAGIETITGNYYPRPPHLGPIHLSSYEFGWVMLAVGAPLGLFAAVMLVRGCPTLTLAERGLILSRCFGGVVNIPWSELADVIIRTAHLRKGPVSIVYLLTKGGKDISAGGVRGKADDIAATIRRVAARMGATLREP
jgi:hypothetical protein